MLLGSIKQGLKSYQRLEETRVVCANEYRQGAGRKATVKVDAALTAALKSVKPVTRGNPESSLRWTCKSLRQLESLN